jgi:Fur family zinc uptake transcriptional regulator
VCDWTDRMNSGENALTRNEAAVFDALEFANGPLRAYEILDLLHGKGFRAPLQVYRALKKLRDAGLVHRLESLNAFVACSHKDGQCAGLAAFAICEDCGGVAEFLDHAIGSHLASWADKQGFNVKKTTIEILGACESCTTSSGV